MYIESFQWKYDPNCNSAEISRHCCTCFYTRFTRHKLDSAHVLQWLPPIWLIQLGPFFYSENCDKPLGCTLQVLLEVEISNMRHVFRLEKNMYEGSFGLEWFILGWSWVCNAQICPDPSACLQPRDSFRIGKSCVTTSYNFTPIWSRIQMNFFNYVHGLWTMATWRDLINSHLKKGVNRIMNHNWGVYTVHMCKAHMLPLFSAGGAGPLLRSCRSSAGFFCTMQRRQLLPRAWLAATEERSVRFQSPCRVNPRASRSNKTGSNWSTRLWLT